MRVGIGYDLHRLEAGRPLILGGVHVPHEKGLLGHSDADVLAHAVTDALLGAAALGNIGQLFPDTDPKYKDADSMALLREVSARVQAAGYRVLNADANIVAQQPKLNPHLDAMRRNLAACLELDPGQVSVKAKTNEHLGPEGRLEAISAQAVVLIQAIGPGQ
jgi:2-C-methyl-D-erythritol 2,4-cyclodiphosphate synthase